MSSHGSHPRGQKHPRSVGHSESSATAADEQHTAAASAPKKAKSSHSHPTSTNMQPTVRDLISDSLAPLANAYWAPGAASLSPFDPQIIESIYLQHLAPINTKAKQREEREAQASAGKHDVDMSDADDLRRLAEEEESEQNELDTQRTQRLLLLELSAYLENYLWKYFDAEKATFAHLMSIVMLLNQKFKENLLSIWESFESRPEAVLIALFERLLHLKQQHDLSVFEANQYLTFLIHAFQSFEHPVVRRVLMKLTTIDCWRTLRESSILRVLRSPESAQTVKGEVSFRDVWKKVEAKPANDFNATFMPNLLIEFVTILYSIQDDSPIFSLDSQPATGKKPRRVPYQIRQHILYLERFLEFLTDCITKLSTRRWVKKLLEEIHFLVLCKQSPLVKRTVQKEKEIQQKQAALASNASKQNRGSDVVDMDTLKATTATSGGAVLSNDNWSNTNASISPLALPGRLFVQMLNIVEYYQFFEIDDANGKPLVAQEVLNAHYLDIQILQKICFKFFEHVPQLKQIALANVSRLEQPDSLRDLLEGVDEAELKDLCVKLQLLPHDEEVAEYKAQQAAVAAPKKSKSASASSAHVPKIIVPLLAYMTSTSFYESILVQSFGIRRNTREEILSMPLYPNEALLFDEHAIPSINYTGDTCLSLPKLSLQFLTLHDYLQRNFKLYQGESTYEIREDIAYTVKRLKPRISADASSTVFTGWARMASPIQSFAVTGALKARIGESKPSLVRAEVTIDLALFSGVVREEWEALQLHDVLFLISVKALVPVHAQINRHAVQQGEDKGRRKFDVEGSDLESSGVVPDESFKALAQEPLLIKYVRGCVVKAVLDGNKRIIGERDDKGNVYKAKGSIRTFRVELDAAQYASDMQKQSQEGVDDIYTSFNLLLRRKPKENNFAGVLETIRDLMADTSSGAANLPEWLRSVFLGYGDPKDSQYYRLANQPDKFEFVDTFLDMQHLKSSFHEKLEIAERSADEIEAEAKGEKELQLVALGEGSNNRQTAASTSIALTRQVRRLVAQAQKDDKSKSATTAEIDSSNSTFRVTFPTEVEPNYQVLQQLLYANDTSMAASVPQPDANVRFMLAEGEQTFKAGGSEQMEDVADASVSKDTAPTAPAPFTKTAPTFTLTEPKKPAAAAASSDSSAADNEAEIAQLSHLTVPKLKEKMKPYNLPTTGAKAQLIERLTEAMRAAAKPAPSSAPTSSAESAEALAAYEKELAAYNEAKSAFEKQLAAFETEKKQHDDAVAAYENSKSVGDGDVEMKDFSAKKGKRGKKAAEESKPAPAAAPATPSAAATIPPSPHTLQVELLPRVHARHGLAKRNLIRFTPTQVEAIKSGLNPGLTLTVGPPGTGKTDVTVQTMSELYHNFPEQRTLIITHSNHALNDIFEKILQRDIDERYLLRLGKGSEDVASESDFSKFGRVNFMLQRRLTLLDEVAALASSLMMNEAVGYTCETAGHFFLEHILARWEKFTSAVDAAQKAKNAELEKVVAANFPFTAYFTSRTEKQNKIWQQYYRSTYGDEAASSMDLSNVSLFRTTSYSEDMSIAVSCWAEIQQTFVELNECAPFELLRSYKDRSNYLLTKHAKVIAMTCTHAAIKHKDFVELGFQFDNLIMEEAAQVLDIETFIPFLLQRNDAVTHKSRLQRIILLGDHHQLPPVIKNRAFSKFSHMDQSLFTRFIRLGMPYIQLNAQGRMRSSLAQLWNWNYQNLGNLPVVNQNPAYQFANVGFVHEFQLINVDDLNGAGESCPTPFFYQNLAEAEYVVQTYMYMRLLGYPASRISIITTYNGQKHLIRDILQQRCANNLLFGLPAKVSTVDKFQGQQNDFILLSLVRTRTAGHLRDVRRLVVAMSRARLGLYVFGRVSLFSNCFELTRTFNQLLQKPTKLQLLPVEKKPMDQGLSTDRPVQALVDPAAILEIRDVVQMSEIVASMTLSVQGEYGEYTRRIQQAAEEERQRREKAQQLAREYAEAREASLRAEAQQQAAMVRETAAAKESEALSREMEDDSAPATKSRRSKQAESESDSDDDK